MKIINRLFFMVALLVGCAAAGMERPENGTWVYLYSDERKQSFVSNYDSTNPDPFIEGWVDTIHERRRDLSRTDMHLEIGDDSAHLVTKLRAYSSLSNHIPTETINSLSNNVQAAIWFLKGPLDTERLSGTTLIQLELLNSGSLGNRISTQGLRGISAQNSRVNGERDQNLIRHLAAIDAEIGNHPATWWKQLYKGELPKKPVPNPTSNSHNSDPSSKTEDPITHSQPTPSNTNQSPINSHVDATSPLPNGTTPPKPQPASNQKAGTIGKPTRDQFINTDGSLKAQEYIEAWNAYKNDGNNVTGDKELAVKFRTKQMLHALIREVNTDLLLEKFPDCTEEQKNAILSFKRKEKTLAYTENSDYISPHDREQLIDVLKNVPHGTDENKNCSQLTWVNILTNAPNISLPNVFTHYNIGNHTYNYDAFITDLYEEVQKVESSFKHFSWDDDNHRRTKLSIAQAFRQMLPSAVKLTGKIGTAQRMFDLLTTLEPIDDDLYDGTHTIESLPEEKLTLLFKATKALRAIPKDKLIAFFKTPSRSLILGLFPKKAVFVALGLATAAAVAGGIYYAMNTGKDSETQLEENG